MNNISEKDWRLFKEKLPVWQERHMARLNEQYIKILSGKASASEKFWTLEKRINRDKRSCGALAEMRKSEVIPCVLELLTNDIITFSDLDGFSEELLARIKTS